MKTNSYINKLVVKALASLALSDILKKKKQPFFKGYKSKWYFEINPVSLGDKYE